MMPVRLAYCKDQGHQRNSFGKKIKYLSYTSYHRLLSLWWLLIVQALVNIDVTCSYTKHIDIDVCFIEYSCVVIWYNTLSVFQIWNVSFSNYKSMARDEKLLKLQNSRQLESYGNNTIDLLMNTITILVQNTQLFAKCTVT